jgi:protein-S-isoprenylcysteine O-methyltransferase Ste14
MKNKIGSLIAFGIVVVCVIFLLKKGYIFSLNPFSIAIQFIAACLMIWARITFGIRSFHASANTTKGELIKTGPYRWLRHPIYAAIIYFFIASIISYPNIETIAAVFLITAGLYARMLFEERFLMKTYPDYAKYKDHTKRILPFLF